MKLTKLDLFGFKSFADRTELHFDAGATVIVGPNGCGKSNVVDAFKWVLGEQSAKSLRGGGMQDVIFNGSSTRKPSGMAEVILTFDNSDHRLPVEQNEVSVGRRLYRDGTSEYLLNKQPVRLRDIKELFMDTGVGVDAYSLVEQGKVDQVLASNTVERRAIFEEAAGVSKYRARKKEAVRKLERVDQNLLRLTDIVAEVDRRLRAIKVAATKARNYQELSHRLRELRVQHFLWEYHKLTESLAAAAKNVQGAQEKVTELATWQADAQGKLARADERQIQVAADLAEVENQLVQIASSMTNHRDRMKFASDREKELAEELTRRRLAMAALRHRLGELAAADRQLSANADELDGAAESARGRIEAIGRDQHAAEIEIHELNDKVGRANDALFDLMRTSSQLSNQLHQHKTTQENLTAQRSRLAGRTGEIEQQLARRVADRGTLQMEVSTLEAELSDLQSRMDQTKAAAAAKFASVKDITSRLGSLKERRSAITGRRDMLASLEQRLEGIADGPRTLLKAQADYERARRNNDTNAEARPHIDGFVGMVADLFMVANDDPAQQAQWTAIVDAALGDHDQWIVVRHAGDLTAPHAGELLASLPGQANILCLDRIASAPALPRTDLSMWVGQSGVIGPVSDMVLCEPVYLPLRDLLLGNTLLVETLDDALRLSAETAWQNIRFLTRDGFTISGGVLAAPAGQADKRAQSPASLSLISRKAELRELNRQLEGLRGDIAQLESELAAESAEAAQLDRSQQELRTATYQRSTEKVERSARLRQIDQSIDAMRSEQALLVSELADLSARIETAAANEKQAADRIAALEQRRQSLQQQADELAVAMKDRRASAEVLHRSMTEAKVALGQVEERRRAVRDQLAASRRALEEAKVQQATAHSDSRSLTQRIEQSQAAQLTGEAAICELFVSRQSLVDRRVELAGALTQVRKTLSELQADVTATGHELHAAEESLHEARSSQNETRVRQEDLVQRVGDEHQMNLPDMYEANRPTADQAGIDWHAVEAEITELRGRIDRLGNVNIEAIDEQEQLEKRSAFLHRQLEDVTRAKEQLAGLIERINIESRRRFEVTFNEVREQFRELFRKLFGGGKADLVLENPDDILESGIEIIARPPGKELRSISLLSGGERTMTALALLLSIFRSHPSPFCILDEVDAALDEANNDRFDQLIRDFMSFSQFIIITHSKQTMTVGDVLYGITMQEQGVSKQVAVRFDGKSVHGDDGQSLEDPPATQVA